MRRRITVVVAALVVMTVGAPTVQAVPRASTMRVYTKLHYKAAKVSGKRAPGRNIRRQGVRTKQGVRPAREWEFRQAIKRLRPLASQPKQYPLIHRTGAPPTDGPNGAMSASVRSGPSGILSSIRSCESGGNYSTNTGNGFSGAYQFDDQTWHSVGGSGSAWQASPAEQDQRAAMLYSQRGGAPWPVCSRR